MEIARLLRGVPVTAASCTHEYVTGITSDSRRVTPGCLFICVRGLHHDGHRHMAEAAERGAAVVLCQSRGHFPEGTDWIVTPDTRLAEALIWNNRYQHPAEKMRTVAITGSNGKTSTAFILRDLLLAGNRKPGAVTTVCAMAGREEISICAGGSSLSDAAGAMTTPDPEYFYGAIAQMREKGCDTLLYEASSHALDQRKTDAIHPEIALFTNLSPEHLDYHGSMEAYLAAKARLFAMADLGICNTDDPWGKRLAAESTGCRILTCTADMNRMEECDTAALRYAAHGADGISFLYCGRDAIFRIRTRLTGRYSMYNVTMAVCCALELGMDPLTVKEALEQMSPAAGRMEKVQLAPKIPFSVFIDYAHTPSALESVLRTAREMHPTRLTVLFGCGGDRDTAKRPLMGEIAGRLADKVVLTGDNAREEDPDAILEQIRDGMRTTPPWAVIPDRAEAIGQTVREAVPGEIILLCGKGHEKYEIRGKTKIPFDEKEIVLEAVRNLP